MKIDTNFIIDRSSFNKKRDKISSFKKQFKESPGGHQEKNDELSFEKN